MKDLVLGLYEGLPIKGPRGGLDAFVRTLRKVNADCTIMIICHEDKVTKEYEEFCSKYDVEIFRYNYSDKMFLKDIHCQTRRFFIYQDVLQNKSYRKVLLSDMDDVIFQSDPFAFNFEKDIYCALEINNFSCTPKSRPKAVYINLKWLESINENKKFYENKDVICTGTLLGEYIKIQEYIEWFTHLYSEYSHYTFGVDTAILNKYVYNSDTDTTFELTEIEYSRILTLDHIRNQLHTFKRDSENKILNQNGEVYSIIHQVLDINQFDYLL